MAASRFQTLAFILILICNLRVLTTLRGSTEERVVARRSVVVWLQKRTLS